METKYPQTSICPLPQPTAIVPFHVSIHHIGESKSSSYGIYNFSSQCSNAKSEVYCENILKCCLNWKELSLYRLAAAGDSGGPRAAVS